MKWKRKRHEDEDATSIIEPTKNEGIRIDQKQRAEENMLHFLPIQYLFYFQTFISGAQQQHKVQNKQCGACSSPHNRNNLFSISF